jgi:hypothetical protein
MVRELEHAPWWRRRLQKNRAFLKRANLAPTSREVAAARVRQCEVVLEGRRVDQTVTAPIRRLRISWPLATLSASLDPPVFTDRTAWVAEIGLDPSAYASHSLKRTKPSLIYRRTKNLRAVQLLPGHSKLESTVRYLASTGAETSIFRNFFATNRACQGGAQQIYKDLCRDFERAGWELERRVFDCRYVRRNGIRLEIAIGAVPTPRLNLDERGYMAMIVDEQRRLPSSQ